MRPAEIIKKLFVKSNVTASSELDDKIMNAALAAFEKSKKISAKHQPNMWRIIMKTKIAKLTIAAVVVIIVVFVGASIFTGSDEKKTEKFVLFPRMEDKSSVRVTDGTDDFEAEINTKDEKTDFTQLEMELEEIEKLFAKADMAGLIDMLDKGQWEAKIVSANYLGQIGDLRAVEPLEQLSPQWQGAESENPFASAVAQIRRRENIKKQSVLSYEAASETATQPAAEAEEEETATTVTPAPTLKRRSRTRRISE